MEKQNELKTIFNDLIMSITKPNFELNKFWVGDFPSFNMIEWEKYKKSPYDDWVEPWPKKDYSRDWLDFFEKIQPEYDEYVDENQFHVEIPLAGFIKEDIVVDFDTDNNLIVTAKRTKDGENTNIKSPKSKFGTYSYVFKPDNSFDKDKTDVQFLNGMLIIKIPKLVVEEKKPRQIIIK